MTATTSLTISGASGGNLSARHTVAQSASLTGRIVPHPTTFLRRIMASTSAAVA
jgi:hypothetical protein